MSLTFGTGPLSPKAAGAFNAELRLPEPLLYFHPYLPRVRAMFENEVVLDSLETRLLHESGRLPVFYFPLADVRQELLEPSQRSEEVPGKGIAVYRSLRVGDRVVPDAAWVFEEPVAEAGFLAGHMSFAWSAVDEWFTEDEQVLGHPRDPYSRIEVLKTTRHVRVSLDGALLAETRRAKVLFETALPPRFYIPPEDARTELLVRARTGRAAPTRARPRTGTCAWATGWSRTSCGHTGIPSTTPSRWPTTSASSTSWSTSRSTGPRRSALGRSGRGRRRRAGRRSGG